MKTQNTILKLIGVIVFLNSTITHAHIKCPFKVFGVTNDGCPIHNHGTFVENKGSKAKKTTPTISKPKIYQAPRVKLPPRVKPPKIKLPPRPKLPPILSLPPKPKLPPPLDHRAIGKINNAAASAQSRLQRENSRLNQNFNNRKDALYNNTSRAFENINNNIEREKQNLSYEIDSINQQRKNFEINNPVDLQGLKNSTRAAQGVTKFSTQSIGTSALGKIQSPINRTISFGTGSNNPIGNKLKNVGSKIKGGLDHSSDKLNGGPEIVNKRGSHINYKISVVNQCHSDIFISLGYFGKPNCKSGNFGNRRQECSNINLETLSWVTISQGNTRTIETKSHWNYIAMWYQDKQVPSRIRKIHNWSYPGLIYPYDFNGHKLCTPNTAPGSVAGYKETKSLQVTNGSIFYGGCPPLTYTRSTKNFDNKPVTRYEPIITHLGSTKHVINVRYENITKSCDAEQSSFH